MKLRELFEKAQIAITYAEAGMADEAREVMSEETSTGGEVSLRTGPRWTADEGSLRSAPARS